MFSIAAEKISTSWEKGWSKCETAPPVAAASQNRRSNPDAATALLAHRFLRQPFHTPTCPSLSCPAANLSSVGAVQDRISQAGAIGMDSGHARACPAKTRLDGLESSQVSFVTQNVALCQLPRNPHQIGQISRSDAMCVAGSLDTKLRISFRHHS